MKVKRKIIQIDEEKCNGCGDCIPSCPEQAIEILQTPGGPKARLVKEFFCDGLGACLGACPMDALTIEEREAEIYDEEATIARVREVAPEMLEVHLGHLKEHAQDLPEQHSHRMAQGVAGCPSAKAMSWGKEVKAESYKEKNGPSSELRNWPIQLHLVAPFAPYFKEADLSIVADCVPFAYADFHRDFLKDRAIAIGCPKLDEMEPYVEKITRIIETANPMSIKVIHMEVPCCSGLVHIVNQAVEKSRKKIPVERIVITIKGEISKSKE